jgi:membrane protease YdiL (CAAX protease family)
MYFMIKRLCFSSLFLVTIAAFATPVSSAATVLTPGVPVDPNPEFRPSDMRPRSTIWPALTSFFLPGFDQYWEGQTQYGLTYSAVGIGGFSLMSANQSKEAKSGDFVKVSQDFPKVGYQILGYKIYDTAGSLSAYHSFKTAVRTRKSEFTFIETEESVQDLLMAPIRFSELAKPTVFVPLGLLTGLCLMTPKEAKGTYGNRASGIDRGVWTTGISYGAGVGEEALFRGWLMPNLHASTHSALGSNLLQGLIFGAAHYSPANPLPVVQTLFGSYLGWRTQSAGYSLRESIFIHFWWDMIVLSKSYFKVEDTQAAYLVPIFSIPL